MLNEQRSFSYYPRAAVEAAAVTAATTTTPPEYIYSEEKRRTNLYWRIAYTSVTRLLHSYTAKWTNNNNSAKERKKEKTKLRLPLSLSSAWCVMSMWTQKLFLIYFLKSPFRFWLDLFIARSNINNRRAIVCDGKTKRRVDRTGPRNNRMNDDENARWHGIVR